MKEIVKTEENIQVKIEGLTKGNGDSIAIAAKIINTSKSKRCYINQDIILYFNNAEYYDYKLSKLNIKGNFYTNENNVLCMDVTNFKIIIIHNELKKYFHNLNNYYKYEIENFSKLKKDTKSFLIALTTGNKTLFENQSKDLFIRTGTIHLFAVSGLHFGVIYLIIKTCLSLFIKKNWITSIIIVLILYLYLVFINEPISATRAFFMLTFWEVHSVNRKKKSALSTISMAFIFSYIANPLSFYSVSFQLSFSIVLVIIWFFSGKLRTNNKGSKSFIINTITASSASFSGSFLILLVSFKQFVPIAIISNIFLVPLAFPMMVACIVYCFFFFLFNIDLIFILDYTYKIVVFLLDFFDFKNFYFHGLDFKLSKANYIILPAIIILFFNINLQAFTKFIFIILIQTMIIMISF
ncbi:MAG: ComEC/Rec2 family competence protein [Opitutales bacterium]|nr:ComEC/Rec2 family competence protein [Opitutales bacterium]